MMMMTPSAPGGAAAADPTLPGSAIGAAVPSPAGAEGQADAGLPALFAQMLDMAGLALPAEAAGAADASAPAAPAETGVAADTAATPADTSLAAMMMPLMNLAALPVVPTQAAVPAADGALRVDGAGSQARTATLLAGMSDQARQAAADAITAATTAGAVPLTARLLQGALPAANDAAPKAGAEQRTGTTATTAANGAATPAAAGTAAPVLAARDANAQSGTDSQGQAGQQGEQTAFRGVMAAGAPASGTTVAAETVKLAGTAEQWQQPLRAALADRLQLTLQKGSDQAVIRLDPPNLGSIEISIRQTAGALQVSLTATHGEVVRQLNAVGDTMRQDLSQRQYGDVAVTVSQASSRSLADGEGRGRQSGQEQQQRGPGRALNDADDSSTTFAMLRE